MRKRYIYIGVAIILLVTTALVMAFDIFKLLQTDPELRSIQNQLLLLNVLMIAGIAGGIYLCHVGIYQTRRKKWIRIIRQANIDFLTGLPNQYKLIKDLKHSEYTNLAFMKFHNYNSILSTYGPAIADGVVKQVAAVLASFRHPIMKKSSCYYIQQAVFAVLEDQQASYEQIAELTKAIVKKIMSTKYQVGDNEYIALNITVGAVRQNEDAFTLANMALQEAENKKLQFYLIDQSQSMIPETYKRDLALTQSLLLGIQERRLVAYYQPIYSAKKQSIKKYECLARLLDNQHQVEMMPNAFLPLAHRANLYYLITRIIISQAVSFAKQNQVVVTINIGMTDINNKRTCDYIYNKVKNSGMGHLIQFELLENEAILESDSIVRFINKVHELGCQVGMDDLGKGYSNIERLINLPIDFVKIDRSIMENVTQNLEMQNVARGIVKLAHKKGLQVVAEFCADAQITSLAKDLGVDYLQGHYLGKPAPNLVQDDSKILSA
jgi:EAL domain-containing protein (putative c-di-GMP-specific phosphodiesterase class I)/GGDEF domain-containing protein